MLSKFNQACFGLDQVFGTQTNSDLCKTKPGYVRGETVVKYFITIDIVKHYKVLAKAKVRKSITDDIFNLYVLFSY